jgi:HD superfamily phosphohydrolase
MRNQNLDETRKVYDNIHGFIEFPQKVWNFIDTKEFQRLRNIKQLGCLSQVFPGATHTRF